MLLARDDGHGVYWYGVCGEDDAERDAVQAVRGQGSGGILYGYQIERGRGMGCGMLPCCQEG